MTQINKNKNQVIKKFIFSAVVMIAFVGSSVAGGNDNCQNETFEFEQSKTQERTIGGPFIEFKITDCNERATAAYNKAKELGATEYFQDEVLLNVLLDCITNG